MSEEWANAFGQPCPVAPELLVQDCQLTKAGRSDPKAALVVHPTVTTGSFLDE